MSKTVYTMSRQSWNGSLVQISFVYDSNVHVGIRAHIPACLHQDICYYNNILPKFFPVSSLLLDPGIVDHKVASFLNTAAENDLTNFERSGPVSSSVMRELNRCMSQVDAIRDCVTNFESLHQDHQGVGRFEGALPDFHHMLLVLPVTCYCCDCQEPQPRML